MDVIRLNKFLVGVARMTVGSTDNADVNADSKVDVSDSLDLLKYVLNIIEELPIRK